MQAYYRIGLDDLLGRDLGVQWFEGVAIVQAVCRQIIADGSVERGFPSTAEVFVCAGGTVELAGTRSSTEAVAAAGHMLNLMLGEDTPVRLRLVATQATAGEAGYQTLQEFSDALAYFERPDSKGLLHGLHDRALNLDAEPHADVPPEFVPTAQPAPMITTQQTTKPEQASEQPQPAKKRSGKPLVFVGIAAGIVCAAVLGLPRGSDGPATAAVVAVQNAVRSTLARVAPAEPVKKEDVKPVNEAVSKTPGRQTGRRPAPQNGGKDIEGRTARSANTLRGGSMPGLLPVGPLPLGPLPMSTFSRPYVAEDVRRDGPEAPALYSALNSEVVPPKSVYPKLPAAPPSGFSLPGQTVLEMVIGTTGRVEHVKLRTDPRNIHEFMLVSAAKAWLFEPARLGGTPVRYLHTVSLTLQ